MQYFFFAFSKFLRQPQTPFWDFPLNTPFRIKRYNIDALKPMQSQQSS